MNPWHCASLICLAGALGGVVNALISGHGVAFTTNRRDLLCPGFFANLLIDAFAAFASWAFYGSGASIDLAAQTEQSRRVISFTFSALAGAFLVGVAGAKWITNEVDKKLLKKAVKIAGTTKLTERESQQIVKGYAMKVLDRVERAAQRHKAA
jgi:hypothetical protein